MKIGGFGSQGSEANEMSWFSRFSGAEGMGEYNRFDNENIMNIQGGLSEISRSGGFEETICRR